MKKKVFLRSAACLLAVSLTAALAGCGSTAESGSTAETATAETATAETAVDESAYDYLADFNYSDGFDENGYLKGVTAADYVTLPDDYAAITIDAALGEVDEQDVTDYINSNILANFATVNQITDRAAADGDTVNIDYVGTIDGVAFEGGDTQGQGTDLELGSGAYIDGFEEQIVGHTPGETFDVNVTFPEDYGNADVAGKDAVFSTTLNYISETVLPELTDEWVQANLTDAMGFADVSELNAFVSNQISLSNQSGDVYSALYAKAGFAGELPESAVNYYRDVLLFGVRNYAQSYGTTMTSIVNSGLLGAAYDTVEDFITDAESAINAQVQQALLLQAVAEKQGLTCDTDTLNTEFVRQFGMSDPSYLTDVYGENYVKSQLLNALVMQNLVDNVQYE
ncbi:MAG TPA: FKBP-type peptidyl-prolyl cis-trans isomerase [Candidatus Gemmiger avistercoris]|uniref:peptidylprolyl isomerase n=1 Tax=Candidatus Gemmiger avistercoris TaxID=2838606 RepID=A0A9D2JNS2_9FIRM|nr:FKBP-type peptidyl-prolyl cis-trans isomerase [uncultured Subdoligranulum sp.]HIZ62285.1 FKBP-type peptidyl-prolyl cis-trans isomerase [Candidatus Gemmiger avistercoris]HJC07743.1 FKBP-type peptidyl-prolyl cis-trans isomerase [Candidatus Gemmiger stercorigallinarum]